MQQGWRWRQIASWVVGRNNASFPWGSAQQRHYSQQTPPPLRDELRRLFKLVHPDLYHNYPEQQAANERSFQLLQEYLCAAKGQTSSRISVYSFEFYVQKQDAEIKKVEVSLPPPQVRRHPQRGAELLPATRSALGRLLSAFGLSAEFSGTLSSDVEKISLSEFFQQASELQRQNDVSALGLEQRMVVVRNALRLGRGLTACFRKPLSDGSLRLQLEALEALARALDAVPDAELRGCTVIIGDTCGVDGMGNLWLNYEDDVRFWSSFLGQVDVSSLMLKRAADKERRLKEFKVARLMEVEMIFTDDALAVKPEYSSFLDRTADDAARRGAVGSGKFQELPVRVTEIANIHEEGGSVLGTRKPLSVDDELGYISVSVAESISNLYKFIEDNGNRALMVRRKFKCEEKRMSELKLHVRRQLRLRHLVLDDKLRMDQVQSACMRLLSHASELRIFTEGLSMCISDEHRLPPKGSRGLVRLKWNFSMSDL